MLELGNTQMKSVSCECMIVDSTQLCKECIVCNSNAMASKEVHSMHLESVNNSRSTTSIRAPSVHSFLCFVFAPVTRASYDSSRAFRSANLALK